MLRPGTSHFLVPWYLVSSFQTSRLPSVGVFWPNGNRTGTTPRATSCKMWNWWYSYGGLLVVLSNMTRFWWLSWVLATPVSHAAIFSLWTHPPMCAPCNVQLSVRHVWLDCPRYTVRHESFYLPSTIIDVLGDDPDILTHVLAFLQAINLFHLL
jgi:hypothetical protein